ncbi:hypothetical protein Taro_051467 [Colocasia esculenta]|uniref:Uncharacterized protein n=1 Tax=Colocasia esculenta TaxID=4460 RepID=A0A843XH30_COLES|nr:hypothetical protein [Colocasia esculenta]
MNSCHSESLPEESRGPEQQELQQAEAKLLYKAVKWETPTAESYKAAEIEKCFDHNPGKAKDDSRRTDGQHNVKANPRHTPAETTELTEHQSDHVRPGSHDTAPKSRTSTRSRNEQPGVTLRDTKQPSENDVSPQARPPLTSSRSRPTSRTTQHLRHSTRSGNYTLRCHHRRYQGMGYQNSWVSTKDTPREPAEWKPLNTAHEANRQNPRKRDMARLQPLCKPGQREHNRRNNVKHRHSKSNQATATGS